MGCCRAGCHGTHQCPLETGRELPPAIDADVSALQFNDVIYFSGQQIVVSSSSMAME